MTPVNLSNDTIASITDQIPVSALF